MSEIPETQVVFVQDQTHHGSLPGETGKTHSLPPLSIMVTWGSVYKADGSRESKKKKKQAGN